MFQQGIPNVLRGEAWFRISGADEGTCTPSLAEFQEPPRVLRVQSFARARLFGVASATKHPPPDLHAEKRRQPRLYAEAVAAKCEEKARHVAVLFARTTDCLKINREAGMFDHQCGMVCLTISIGRCWHKSEWTLGARGKTTACSSALSPISTVGSLDGGGGAN